MLTQFFSQHHKRAGYKNTPKPDNRSAEAQLEHCQKMLKPVYKQRNSGEGPLENLSGPGGRGARKKSRKGKLNEKKFLHAN